MSALAAQLLVLWLVTTAVCACVLLAVVAVQGGLTRARARHADRTTGVSRAAGAPARR